jgi:formylglycine-generating enzyme required for sulfatase activity
MKLVLIPAGKFKMDNHDTPAGTVKKVGGFERNLVDEYPAHEVTISKPFYMGHLRGDAGPVGGRDGH